MLGFLIKLAFTIFLGIWIAKLVKSILFIKAIKDNSQEKIHHFWQATQTAKRQKDTDIIDICSVCGDVMPCRKH